MLSFTEYKSLLESSIDSNTISKVIINTYEQDKQYYKDISIDEVKAIIDSPFINKNASNVKEASKDLHYHAIVQDFSLKAQDVLGIESETNVKSKLLAVSDRAGLQSRIILSENFGKRLLRDSFNSISQTKRNPKPV